MNTAKHSKKTPKAKDDRRTAVLESGRRSGLRGMTYEESTAHLSPEGVGSELARLHQWGLLNGEHQPVASLGMTGPDVRAVQAALRSAGYDVRLDGLYGPNTAAAVAEFQRSVGLPDTGIAGLRTIQRLEDHVSYGVAGTLNLGLEGAGPGDPFAALRVADGPYLPERLPAYIREHGAFRRGASGAAVELLQQLIFEVTGQDLSVELGHYGRQTVRVVRRFQRSRGLKADGVVGNNTIQALVGADDLMAPGEPRSQVELGGGDTGLLTPPELMLE